MSVTTSTTMKILFAVLVIVALSTMAEGTLAPGLRVKFDMDADPGAGTSYFFKLPLTVSIAAAEGWRKTKRPHNQPLTELVMYCPPDKVLCLFYDDLEDVAGLQIALSKSNFTNNLFDWKTRGFTSWNTAVDGKCVTKWTLQQYFVSEESLKLSKEERQARSSTGILKENALWVTGVNGELRKISSDEQDIIDEQIFTKQACLAWMGQHWYYNMSSTTPCDAENMYPWFPMTLEGQIIASGFLTIGNLPIGSYRDWFERPAPEVVQAIVPYGSDCLYEVVTDPGALTMHIYYTDTPWLITC